MKTIRIYNNNPAFGDGGPFEFEAATFDDACDALVGEMESTFQEWAWDASQAADATPDNTDDWIYKRVHEMREEFRRGLTEVRRCSLCGRDYNLDAPERGHADDCDWDCDTYWSSLGAAFRAAEINYDAREREDAVLRRVGR